MLTITITYYEDGGDHYMAIPSPLKSIIIQYPPKKGDVLTIDDQNYEVLNWHYTLYGGQAQINIRTAKF